MDTPSNTEQWRLNLLANPPRAAKHFTQEEWRHIVLHELTNEPNNIFCGEKNGNFCGHPQTEETRKKISENNAKYWLGKTGEQHPATARSRPDSVEIARRMGIANRGKPAWNSGKTGVQSHSLETRQKMSAAKIGKIKNTVQCPNCGKFGGEPAMARWHFDNCKNKK